MPFSLTTAFPAEPAHCHKKKCERAGKRASEKVFPDTLGTFEFQSTITG